jgi:hypothetical protein
VSPGGGPAGKIRVKSAHRALSQPLFSIPDVLRLLQRIDRAIVKRRATLVVGGSCRKLQKLAVSCE